jgi:Cd2+/Zn2+-exporting ATPase
VSRGLQIALGTQSQLDTLSPAEATVESDGHKDRVLVSEVAVGEVVLVRPGERIPVDGEVRCSAGAPK